MKKSNILPILAVVLGAVCFGLRRWQMAVDFDALGLPLPGAATHALTAVGVLAPVLFAALLLPRKGESRWSEVLGERRLLPLYASALLCAGALVPMVRAGGVVPEDTAVFAMAARVIPLLMLLGTAAAAVGLFLAAPGGANRGQNLVLPTLLGCFWTVAAYHEHGTDPVVGHFVWLILAVVSSTLGWYELTALSMDRGHARRACFLSLTTVVYSLAALAGGVNLQEGLLLAAQTVGFFTVAASMEFGVKSEG